VIAFALPIGVTGGNRIEFGPPGPPNTIAFDDGIAVVSATFRISHDRQQKRRLASYFGPGIQGSRASFLS
jgi:hypothetical protein